MRRYFKAGIKILGLLGICTELSKSAWRSAAAVLTVRNIFWIQNSRVFLNRNQPDAGPDDCAWWGLITVTTFVPNCVSRYFLPRLEPWDPSRQVSNMLLVWSNLSFSWCREGEGGEGPKTRTLYKYWRGGDTLRWPPPPPPPCQEPGGGMGTFGISVKLLQIRLIGLQQLLVKFVLWVAVVTAAQYRGPRSHLNQIEYVFSLMLLPRYVQSRQ